MPLEALTSSEHFPGLLAYERPFQGYQHPDGPYISALLETLSSGGVVQQQQHPADAMSGSQQKEQQLGTCGNQQQQGGGGRKKRRRRARVCKNKEEAETQRMTHIAVERNRRRQMNDHLASLRSLMPDSYIHRGDQASIVGGAIDFVRELEQLLQSLEAQKHASFRQQSHGGRRRQRHTAAITNVPSMASSPGGTCLDYDDSNEDSDASAAVESPFAQFFSYPQYVRWSGRGGCGVRDCCVQAAASDGSQQHQHHQRSASGGVADIEVTLVETHASMRILSARRPGQLLRMVAGFHALQLTVLHLNLTTLDPLVFYTVSAKVEEGCSLTTVDDIAAAVHHMLILIEAES